MLSFSGPKIRARAFAYSSSRCSRVGCDNACGCCAVIAAVVAVVVVAGVCTVTAGGVYTATGMCVVGALTETAAGFCALCNTCCWGGLCICALTGCVAGESGIELGCEFGRDCDCCCCGPESLLFMIFNGFCNNRMLE